MVAGTDLYCLLRFLRHGVVIFAELECIGVKRFLRFSRKLQHESVPIFQGLGEN